MDSDTIGLYLSSSCLCILLIIIIVIVVIVIYWSIIWSIIWSILYDLFNSNKSNNNNSNGSAGTQITNNSNESMGGSKIASINNPYGSTGASTSANNANGSIGVVTGGSLPYTCTPIKFLYNGLCYNKCNDLDAVKQDLKFDNSGSYCISNCPEVSIDYSESCEKPENSYINPGRAIDISCPAEWSMQGIDNVSTSWCLNPDKRQSIPTTKSCKPNEINFRDSCYPKCKTDYHSKLIVDKSGSLCV